jgi:cytochrome oxidase assembly protein ShyY1
LKQSTLRRWGPWLALVVLFAIITSLLSWWQFARREERVERINEVIANYDRPPVPLSDIGFEITAGKSAQEWRPVNVAGRYLSDLTTLVRNRPLNGQAGFLQLVPFELNDGRIMIIERGWLIAGSDLSPTLDNPLPIGEPKQLVVRLRVSETDLGRPPIPGQIASIDLDTLATRFESSGEVITEFYGRLVSETPGSEAFPIAVPKPSLNEGNHLSYALQWVMFGLMAFGAFIWAIRNDRRIQLEEAGILAPKTKKRTQALIDAEIEDAD